MLAPCGAPCSLPASQRLWSVVSHINVGHCCAQASAFAGGERQGGLISQAFTALSARRGSALGRSLSRLEPQVQNVS